jgi:hypothetical protein
VALHLLILKKRIALVPVSSSCPESLAISDEYPSQREDSRSDQNNSNNNPFDTHSMDPWVNGKDESSTEGISEDSDTN